MACKCIKIFCYTNTTKCDITLFFCVFILFYFWLRLRKNLEGTCFKFIRRVATSKPDKPELTGFSKILALFFIQFFLILENETTGKINGPRAYKRKLAGYASGLDTEGTLKEHASNLFVDEQVQLCTPGDLMTSFCHTPCENFKTDHNALRPW